MVGLWLSYTIAPVWYGSRSQSKVPSHFNFALGFTVRSSRRRRAAYCRSRSRWLAGEINRRTLNFRQLPPAFHGRSRR